jgi:acyl-CoA synthetase (AMP-forming)/AMP-acid ligase II
MKRGNLHVTGRLKDLIIINGRNVAPQDVEFEVEQAHDAIQGCVAFAHIDGEIETLVLVAEVDRDCLRDAALKQVVREAAAQAAMSACQTPPTAVELVPPATIPRTSSGKLRRSQTREDWVAGRLRGVEAAARDRDDHSQPPSP